MTTAPKIRCRRWCRFHVIAGDCRLYVIDIVLPDFGSQVNMTFFLLNSYDVMAATAFDPVKAPLGLRGRAYVLR